METDAGLPPPPAARKPWALAPCRYPTLGAGLSSPPAPSPAPAPDTAPAPGPGPGPRASAATLRWDVEMLNICKDAVGSDDRGIPFTCRRAKYRG